MTNENVETAKADAKKGIVDIGNKMAYANADVNADVEKIKPISDIMRPRRR